MRFTKQPKSEPLPGYRLLEPMGSGGFGEVWKCEAPGGLLKAIKFVYGSLNNVGTIRAPAQEELDAIQRVKVIRHPFLLSMERVECLEGELIIVMELADKNLFDRVLECTQAGLVGIPREELLSYMTEAAEALDLMNVQHNLQHLDIKPHNLFLVCNHVKVGDFGLVHHMGGPKGRQADAPSVTPLYASPETFLGQVSASSDQYSLAIVYQELLTRTLPYTGKNARQLLLSHTQGEPDLHALPEWDRPAIAKALAKDPKARFPSCGHFVRALVSGWIPNQLALVAGLDPETFGAELAAPEPEPAAVEEAAPLSATLFGGSETVSAKVQATQETVREPSPLPLHWTGAVTGPFVQRSTARKDYELGERVRTSPVSEVWRARTPDGQRHLVTQVFGWTRHGKALEEALLAFQALRHPVLLEPSILECEAGRLVFATDPAERTLRERLQECQAQGLPGIPRAELLGYLGTAAATLDELFRTHQVAHAGLTPRHLLLDDGQLRIRDFGLAQLFWLPGGASAQCVGTRYAAPELVQGQPDSFCDQYSLALICVEMLTGTLPRRSRTAGSPWPDLAALPDAARAALVRALDPQPQKRWPCSADLVRALGGDVPEPGTLGALVQPRQPTAVSPVVPAPKVPRLRRGQKLRGKFSANLPVESTRQRFEGFRYQWNAEVVRSESELFICRVTMLGTLWQNSLGEQPGLEVEVHLQRSPSVPGAPTEVAVQITPVSCGREQGAGFLEEMGNLLFESLQAHLHAVPQRRTEERLPWHYALQVRPLLRDGVPGEPIDCQGKDISLNGIGFYAPQELRATQVNLILPETPQTPRVATLANVVRVQRCGAGWFEVGAILLTPAQREETARVPEQMAAAL